MGATIKTGGIADRLGVSRGTAWRWSRQGKFGEPVNRDSREWEFTDDESLALLLENARHRARAVCQWSGASEVAQVHGRRLGSIMDGERVTSAEDLRMAAAVLDVAACRHDARRIRGRGQLPATSSAAFMAEKWLARSMMHDESVPVRLREAASRLMALAGNTSTAGTE